VLVIAVRAVHVLVMILIAVREQGLLAFLDITGGGQSFPQGRRRSIRLVQGNEGVGGRIRFAIALRLPHSPIAAPSR